MKIEIFVKKVIEQNPNNKFEKYEGKLNDIPKELQPYYKRFNPKKAEVGYNGTSVCLISAENLEKENAYYKNMGIGFVFATCDGDPIFYYAGKVYTCPHGVKKPEWECLSETIEDYFDSIIIN